MSDEATFWRMQAERAAERIKALEERVKTLEAGTPQARQLQYEADLAAADLAASGYDRHGPGCPCPYCPPGEG